MFGIFKRKGYVEEPSNIVAKKPLDQRKALIILAAIILGITIIVFTVTTINTANKNKTCNSIEEAYEKGAIRYLEDNNMMPAVETEEVTVDGEMLIKENYVSESDITIDESRSTATVVITKYFVDDKQKDEELEYLKRVELSNASYCSTEERYSDYKTSSKLPKGNVLVEIEPKYNYYETTTYQTEWTKYYEPDEINTEKDDEFGIKLPLNEKAIPDVPSPGITTFIEQEDKTYYSYVDTKWKFYKNNNNDYSEYVTEQPAGFANKDKSSIKVGEWTEYSLDYPEVKDYRDIRSKTGYRWFYKEDGEKVYWNNGAYSVEQPGDKYTEKEEKATVYSYRDDYYRWYNGEARQYSSYTSTAPRNYVYVDLENSTKTNQSSWRDINYGTEENASYREVFTQIRSRYRVHYEVYSFLILDEYVDKTEFEKITNTSYRDFYNKENIEVDVEYTYKYRSA